MNQDENIVWHNQTVSREQKQQHKGHKPVLLWYTGLSGSGKSTIANAVEAKLFELGCHTYLLDGDNVRMGLNKGLTFSDEDRVENIRRISEVAKLFVDAGLIVSTAFISPFKADREQARSIVNEGEFVEVFIDKFSAKGADIYLYFKFLSIYHPITDNTSCCFKYNFA